MGLQVSVSARVNEWQSFGTLLRQDTQWSRTVSPDQSKVSGPIFLVVTNL